MPDGDIVHSNLSRLYQKPYRLLCEGKLNRDECIWITMNAIKQDIKNKGAAPVVLAKRMGESLEQAIEDASKNSSVDWAALSMKLDRLARQAECPHSVKELVLYTGKRILHDLRYKREMKTSSLSEIFVERYIQELYRSNFEERIPLTSEHHAGIDNITLAERIEAIRPDILTSISKWAKKANAEENVANLRRFQRRKVDEVDLEEDLL